MKNLFLAIVIVIVLILFSFGLFYSIFCFKHPYGYFINGPETIFQHSTASSVLTLKNGDLLILGNNIPKAKLFNRSELYNLEKNKFEEYNLLQDEVYYNSKGAILLDDDKILLPFVHNPKDTYKEFNSLYLNPNFNSMAIVDLKLKKVDKYIYKKINNKYPPNIWTKFLLLGNGNILIVDFKNRVAEVYNPKSNTSKILDIKFNKDKTSQLIAYGKDKALIFGPSDNNLDSMNTVLEYDDTTATLKPVGKVSKRSVPYIYKFSDNRILLFGGLIGYVGYPYPPHQVQDIEIYDTETHTSKIIGQFTELRKTSIDSFEYSGISLNDHLFLIAGGAAISPPILGSPWSTDLVDLKNDTVVKGPNMKYPMPRASNVRLNNGNIIFIGGVSTQIFKTRKGFKY